MTVAYAASDIQTIVISPEQGGCGQSHGRDGARVFKLTCPQCAAVVLGENRPPVTKFSKDRGYMKGQADVWQGWSPTLTDVPLTFDELLERDRVKKDGQTDLERLQAMAMAAQLGIPVPEALASALGGVRALEELRADPQVICPDGHANRPGARFCDTCAVSMQVPAAGDPEASV